MTNRHAISFLLLAGLLLPAGAWGQGAVQLKIEPARSQTGDYQLSWDAPEIPEGQDFLLQEDKRETFEQPEVVYQGPDRAVSVSGRPDGVYYYRLRHVAGPWSKVQSVEVVHHHLGKALLFLGVGASVFLATVVLVVVGHWKHRRDNPVG